MDTQKVVSRDYHRGRLAVDSRRCSVSNMPSTSCLARIPLRSSNSTSTACSSRQEIVGSLLESGSSRQGVLGFRMPLRRPLLHDRRPCTEALPHAGNPRSSVGR